MFWFAQPLRPITNCIFPASGVISTLLIWLEMPICALLGHSGEEWSNVDPSKLILSVWVFYLAATFRENRSESETLRVQTVGWTHRCTCTISLSVPCSAIVMRQIITDFVVYYGCTQTSKQIFVDICVCVCMYVQTAEKCSVFLKSCSKCF